MEFGAMAAGQERARSNRRDDSLRVARPAADNPLAGNRPAAGKERWNPDGNLP
jgi:hypothetical protein